MQNFLENNSIWLIVNCLVFWTIGMLLFGIIPIGIYILTGRARTSAPMTRYMIIMEGKKAFQFVMFQLCLCVGCVFTFLGYWVFENDYWWIGIIMIIVSIPFMINATIGARHDARKNSYYDIKELWRR